MKNIYFITLLIYFTLSCEKDKKDEGIDKTVKSKASACFTFNEPIYYIGNEITYLDCSEKVNYSEWFLNNINFGSTLLYTRLDSASTYIIKQVVYDDLDIADSLVKSLVVTNQYLQMNGSWDIAETDRFDSSHNKNYTSTITNINNKGSINFSKISRDLVSTTLQLNLMGHPVHHIVNNYITNISLNTKVNIKIFYDINNPDQFTGSIEYFTGTSYKYTVEISGVKK